jgi:hypothetical protein
MAVAMAEQVAVSRGIMALESPTSIPIGTEIDPCQEIGS